MNIVRLETFSVSANRIVERQQKCGKKFRDQVISRKVGMVCTLEATEVIGRSKESIMDKMKTSIEIRNKVQSAGDEFARKYALKSTKRNAEFDKDIEKLRATLNDPKIVLLELDAYERNVKVEEKDLKKIFLDYGADNR